MTNELSNFAARLRGSINWEGRVARIPNSQVGIGDSCNSSLREDAVFDSLALELFALQFQHNPAYRKICEARRVTPLVATDWRQIPAVPTAAFKELDLTCLPSADRSRVFHSSGTTGQQPSRHFHSPSSLAVYEDSLWTWFAAHVLSDLQFPISNLQFAMLTPAPTGAPHSSLVHMFETVRRKVGAADDVFLGRTAPGGEWTLDFDQALARLIAAASGGRPLVLLGTAFSFVHLLDFLQAQGRGVRLPPGSIVMETGGYKGRSRALSKAELHGLIADCLGVSAARIVCEYGMSELSSQAYDLALDGTPNTEFSPRTTLHAPRRFRFPAWARTQIISPETGREAADGETGLLRVFDLANVFSVLAVQTEDLALRRGDGFELLGRAQLSEPRGCSLMTA